MRAPFRFLATVAVAVASIASASAQSILRDAETEALFHDMATPLVKAAGLDPNNVDIVLVNDPSLNAFVAGGQAVYVHSGLIDAAEGVDEVQGVVAHELGHVTGGHAIYNPGAEAAGKISILSMLLGVAAAAAGAGDAAMGVIMAGQQAAMGKFLSYSRGQEASADAAGAKYLSGAGISGRGSVRFFQRLANMEMRYQYTPKGDDAFMTTHPLTADRIATLTDTYQRDAAWNRPPDAALQARFTRVRAKLYGYLAAPKDTLRRYPESDTSDAARYARAYAWHKDAQLDKAMGEADALLAAHPDDPYYLELKGQVLLEAGRPQEALAPLRRATTMTGNQPLIATTFGHALIATEDQANFAEAERVLKAAVSKDRENPFAWYQLGVVYEARGDHARARLASAEQQLLNGELPRAAQSAEAAEAQLPTGSPDWLRAQDIAMSARAAVEQQRKRK